MMAEFYKVKQVAELLGVSRSTVRRRIRAGKLEAEKVDGPNGKEYRLPVDQFDEVCEREEESEEEEVDTQQPYESKFRRVIIEALKEKRRIEKQKSNKN